MESVSAKFYSGEIIKSVRFCWIFLILLILLIIPGCSDFPVEDENGKEEVLPVIFASDDGMATIRVPEDSLLEGTVISFEDVSATTPEGAIGPVYKLAPEGTLFDSKAKLILSYNPDDLPAGVMGENLSIARLYNDSWVAVNTDHNADNQTLSTSIGVLSTFGMVVVDSDDIVELLELNKTANDIYQALEDGEDVTELLFEVFGAFAPVLNMENDENLIYELRDHGIPFFLEFQIEMIAEIFSRGILINLNSFFESLNFGGIEQSDTIGEISYNNVSVNMIHLPLTFELMPIEVLPALVLQLGKARAQRYVTDRTGFFSYVWGDDYLDVIQFTLLSYAFHYAAVDVGPAAEVEQQAAWIPIVYWVGKQLCSGFIGDIIGLPLGPRELVSFIQGFPVFVIHGYTANIEAKPGIIHQRCDQITLPYESLIEVDIVFNDIYENGLGSSAARAIDNLVLYQRKLPDPGPASDVKVQLSAKENIWDRGYFDDDYLITDSDGEAQTKFIAQQEPVPVEKRAEVDYDVGYVKGSISYDGLLPKSWRTLAKLVIEKTNLGEAGEDM